MTYWKEKFEDLIAGIVMQCIAAVLTMIVYNNFIAYEFNLPTFNFWFFLLAKFAFNYWTYSYKPNK